MKKIALAAAAASILFTGAASAADMAVKARPVAPPVVVYDWTGFYIGANVGGAWGGNRDTLVDFTSDGYDLGPAFRSTRESSWLAGVHGGYNWQTASRFVLGIEGDFEFTDIKHNDSGILLFGGLPFGDSRWNVSDKLNWLASARVRLGYAAGNFMPYVTGGAAWSDVEYTGFVTNNLAAGGGFGPYDQTITRTGWVAGAGLEYMATPNWLFRVEYLHYGFDGERIVGATHPTFVPGARGVFTLGSTHYDTVRAGVSYKFGGPVVARY